MIAAVKRHVPQEIAWRELAKGSQWVFPVLGVSSESVGNKGERRLKGGKVRRGQKSDDGRSGDESNSSGDERWESK